MTVIRKVVLNEKDEVDFNLLIPRPAILTNTVSGGHKFDGVIHKSWYGEPNESTWGTKNERPFTPEEEVELDKIGYRNSIDWAYDKWGTKWNAYDQEGGMNDIDEYSVRLSFATAWGPPTAWIKALREKFPQAYIGGIYVIEFNEDAGTL